MSESRCLNLNLHTPYRHHIRRRETYLTHHKNNKMDVVDTCSGHGILLNYTSKCLCDEGWDSIGDFNPIEGLDCGIHRQSVVVLAWVSFILGGIAFFVFGHYLIQRILTKREFDIRAKFALTYLIQTITCNICNSYIFELIENLHL